MLYIDGFAEKAHRGLMQFALDRKNDAEEFRRREAEFRDIYAYLDSIRPPIYPLAIDRKLATQGERVFETVCAECHGTYGELEAYPNRIVPIEDIGTDRARHDALSVEHRKFYRRSWFSGYGKDRVVVDPGGYMAPPLDGIWASAPYLHNGSVPTLWHLLHPDERPTVWKRSENGYDEYHVGILVSTYNELPHKVILGSQQRQFFDTRKFGKSHVGHDYPEQLSEQERRQVLEYLKTL
ncbi:MAG: c-type cytochrome [Pirellulales bacterium]